jgi:hypothetical protein
MEYVKPLWKKRCEQEGTSLPGYYTLIEASKFLGYSNSSWLSQQIKAGKLISYKIGVYRLLSEDIVKILFENDKMNSRR